MRHAPSLADRDPTIAAVVSRVGNPGAVATLVEYLAAADVRHLVLLADDAVDTGTDPTIPGHHLVDIRVIAVDGVHAAGTPGVTAAILEHVAGADWVAFLDARDILLAADGSLARIGDLASADVLMIPRYRAMPGASSDASAPPATVGERPLVARPFGDPDSARGWGLDVAEWEGMLGPALMARPGVIERVGADVHSVRLTADASLRQQRVEDALVLHVPEGGQIDHDRATASRLVQLRDRGIVRTAHEILARPVPPGPPPFGPDPATDDSLLRTEPWFTLAGRVCRQEGISVDVGWHVPADVSSFPIVVVSPDLIIKLLPRERDGFLAWRREERGLRLATADPAIPVPRLLAAGTLDDDWRYLVMERLPGTNFTWAWEHISTSNAIDVASWLGSLARRFHALPMPADEQAAGLAEFEATVEYRHARASGALRERGALPDRLIDEVARWLPSVDELLAAPGGTVLTHGGLRDDHVLGVHDRDLGSFRPTGLIDMGGSLVGHPLREIGQSWWTFLSADRRLTESFLRAAELPGRHDPGFARLALAWALLQPAWHPKAPPEVGDAADLDDLARACFGR